MEYKTNTKVKAVVRRVTDGIIWADVTGIAGSLPFDENEGWCLLNSKRHIRIILPKKKKEIIDLSKTMLAVEAECDCI